MNHSAKTKTKTKKKTLTLSRERIAQLVRVSTDDLGAVRGGLQPGPDDISVWYCPPPKPPRPGTPPKLV